jgi:hypothetical protein
VKWFDIGQVTDPMFLEPGEKRARGAVIGQTGVVVLDRGRKNTRKRSAARSSALAIIDGTTSELRNAGAVAGAAVPTTAGSWLRSPLTATPYNV